MTSETVTSRPWQASPHSARARLTFLAKRLLFPGLDLHTRCRYRHLPQHFRQGELDTLDAGCGNGALTYAAYKNGNRVIGITKDQEQVDKSRTFFYSWGVDPSRLQFEVCDLYDLPRLNRKFDQIICSETLEHISRDDLVVRYFNDLLRSGGVLHLCSPFSNHPEHAGRFDTSEERGWHVRDGYTLESYRDLLEPAGFRINTQVGLGAPITVALAKPISYLFYRLGPLAAIPAFLCTWPLQLMDTENPRVPFSLYVQAVKN
jgi:SAM-dependent methyltransferase